MSSDSAAGMLLTPAYRGGGLLFKARIMPTSATARASRPADIKIHNFLYLVSRSRGACFPFAASMTGSDAFVRGDCFFIIRLPSILFNLENELFAYYKNNSFTG